MSVPEYITLTQEHVGRTHIFAFGRTWGVANFMGRIMERDVGKRVYLVDGILQVENDEQKDAREARKGIERAAARSRSMDAVRDHRETVRKAKMVTTIQVGSEVRDRLTGEVGTVTAREKPFHEIILTVRLPSGKTVHRTLGEVWSVSRRS